jgi:hypothetical protein
MTTQDQADPSQQAEGWVTWARSGIDYFRTELEPGEDPVELMQDGIAERELEPDGWDFDERVMTGYQLPGGPEMKPFTVEVVAPDPDTNYPRTTYCVLAASSSEAREKVINRYAHGQMLDEDVAGNPQTAEITVVAQYEGTPRKEPWTDLRNAG